jgi:hypothetical protein
MSEVEGTDRDDAIVVPLLISLISSRPASLVFIATDAMSVIRARGSLTIDTVGRRVRKASRMDLPLLSRVEGASAGRGKKTCVVRAMS